MSIKKHTEFIHSAIVAPSSVPSRIPFHRAKRVKVADSTEALTTPFMRSPSEACWELQDGLTPEPSDRRGCRLTSPPKSVLLILLNFIRFIIFFSLSLFYFSCKRADEARRRRRRTGVMNDGKLISQSGG